MIVDYITSKVGTQGHKIDAEPNKIKSQKIGDDRHHNYYISCKHMGLRLASNSTLVGLWNVTAFKGFATFNKHVSGSYHMSLFFK